MSSDWTWACHDAQGAGIGNPLGEMRFPSQSDAESWVGETWRDLLDAGVEAVTLMEGDRVVYGPMGLRAA